MALRSEYETRMLNHLWTDQAYRGRESLPGIADKYSGMESIHLASGSGSGRKLVSGVANYILQDKDTKVNWGQL